MITEEDEIAKYANFSGERVTIAYNEYGNPFKLENYQTENIQIQGNKKTLVHRNTSLKCSLPPCVSHGSKVRTALSPCSNSISSCFKFFHILSYSESLFFFVNLRMKKFENLIKFDGIEESKHQFLFYTFKFLREIFFSFGKKSLA